jgi:hypothetical protein
LISGDRLHRSPKGLWPYALGTEFVIECSM